jgi:hypothetical protein
VEEQEICRSRYEVRREACAMRKVSLVEVEACRWCRCGKYVGSILFVSHFMKPNAIVTELHREPSTDYKPLL